MTASIFATFRRADRFFALINDAPSFRGRSAAPSARNTKRDSYQFANGDDQSSAFGKVFRVDIACARPGKPAYLSMHGHSPSMPEPRSPVESLPKTNERGPQPPGLSIQVVQRPVVLHNEVRSRCLSLCAHLGSEEKPLPVRRRRHTSCSAVTATVASKSPS